MAEKELELTVGKSVGLFILFVLGIIAIIALFNSVYIISAGQRGVLLRWGEAMPNPISEGLHFKVPVQDKVIKMDIKTQKYEADASAASQDLQIVTSKIATNYHLDGSRVSALYKEVGLDYAVKIIMPLEQEVVKSVTAKFTAEQLITMREMVRLEMKNALTERLAARGIIVEEVSIVNFDFSPQFNDAIEAKVTAEQQALAAKNKLAQVEYEAKQRVAQAEGEALAIKTQAEAIRAQGGKEYVQLQAISKWDGKMPTFMMNGNNGVTPFIDLNQITNKA